MPLPSSSVLLSNHTQKAFGSNQRCCALKSYQVVSTVVAFYCGREHPYALMRDLIGSVVSCGITQQLGAGH